MMGLEAWVPLKGPAVVTLSVFAPLQTMAGLPLYMSIVIYYPSCYVLKS